MDEANARPERSKFRIFELHQLTVLGILALVALTGCHFRNTPREVVRIGAKNFSEQLLLGEMMSLLLEQEGIAVERKFGLGSTPLIHGALIHGNIDLYAEYTGTAAQAILQLDPKASLDQIRKAYHDQFQVQWLAPFNFNNTYAIAVRGDDATTKHWTKISDLKTIAPKLKAGFNAEFLERPDGWPGLKTSYGLDIGKVINLDAGLIYQALKEGQVDLIGAFATDGRLDAFHFRILEDDHHFFPNYHPAPIIRETILPRHPRIPEILGKLNNILDETTMRRLNYEVDGYQHLPANVAREFLLKKKLLRPTTG